VLVPVHLVLMDVLCGLLPTAPVSPSSLLLMRWVAVVIRLLVLMFTKVRVCS
jgi:hypothetical protein